MSENQYFESLKLQLEFTTSACLFRGSFLLVKLCKAQSVVEL